MDSPGATDRGPDRDREAAPGPGRPFVVEPSPTREAPAGRQWAMAGALVALCVVALSAWGIAVRQGASPPRPTPTEAVAGTPATGSPASGSPAVLTGGLPTADVGSSEDAFDVLSALTGWGACPIWRGFNAGGSIDPADVDAAVGPRSARGMLTLTDSFGEPYRVWLGSDEADAARGFGGSMLVREPAGDWTAAWTDDGWRAYRLRMRATPAGRRYWEAAATAQPAAYCGPYGHPSGAPARVVHVGATEDALARLFDELGWTGCRSWLRSEGTVAPPIEEIDRALGATAEEDDPGTWVSVAGAERYPGRQFSVWVGEDEATAAAVHGTRLLVLGPGDRTTAWLRVDLDGHPAAVALRVVRTPAGFRAWLPTQDAAGLIGPCGRAASPGLP